MGLGAPGSTTAKTHPIRRLSAASKALYIELIGLVYPAAPPCFLCRGPSDIDRSIAVCSRCIGRLVSIGSRRCRLCGRAVGHQTAAGAPRLQDRILGRRPTLTCSECRRTRQAFDYARAYGVYDGYLRALIHQLKYGGDASIARGLGELMAWVVASDTRFGRIDGIIPVPLHPSRLQARGFNQAALLAAAVARQLRRPMIEPLVRVQETPSQSKLSMRERAHNVRRAFAVPRPDAVRGKRILIVDDVLTTGATLSAAARTLKRSGAQACVAVCAAASSLDQDFDHGVPGPLDNPRTKIDRKV